MGTKRGKCCRRTGGARTPSSAAHSGVCTALSTLSMTLAAKTNKKEDVGWNVCFTSVCHVMLFLCESASPVSGQTPVRLAAVNVRPGVCGTEVTPCHDKARRARQFKQSDRKLFTGCPGMQNQINNSLGMNM